MLDFRDVKPLFGVERDLWRNQDYRRFGGVRYAFASQQSWQRRSADVEGILALGAPFAAIPEHTARRDHAARRVSADAAQPREPAAVFADRSPRTVAPARWRQRRRALTIDLIAAADFMVVDRRVVFAIVPPLRGQRCRSGDKSIQLREAAARGDRVRQRPGSAAAASVDSLLIRGSGSLRGKVKTWDWELSLLRSEEDAEVRVDSVIDDRPACAGARRS